MAEMKIKMASWLLGLILCCIVATQAEFDSIAHREKFIADANCVEHFHNQTLNHFLFSDDRIYLQRYFLCDGYWAGPGAPIFFYFGNEADVTLYVNHTGLMFENAATYGALLIFAEHRYYGKSKPFPNGTPGCMDYLTTEQAMADYAEIILHLKSVHNTTSSAVIGFGGSYGGMIASWFRMKYPYIVDGVIAGSAPIWSFLKLSPPYNENGFYEVVTRDASAEGMATDYCKANIKYGAAAIHTLAETTEGRTLLADAFKTCASLSTYEEAAGLTPWMLGPWASMAMGEYPYPSDYLTNGDGMLPPYPVKYSCQYLNQPLNSSETLSTLMTALREAVAVFYNVTGSATCFYNGDTEETKLRAPMLYTSPEKNDSLDEGNSCYGSWGYQYCTEMVQPFTSGTNKDMYWPKSVFSLPDTIARCIVEWGVVPRSQWVPQYFASKDLSAFSNIVFSNGLLDPWSSGGILQNISSSVVAVIIPLGGHHVDLMFSNPADTPDILVARQTELAHITAWIAEHEASQQHLFLSRSDVY